MITKIGKRIRQLRKERGLTQIQLSNLTNITQCQISLIENGKNVELSSLTRIADGLGCTIDVIIKKKI